MFIKCTNTSGQDVFIHAESILTVTRLERSDQMITQIDFKNSPRWITVQNSPQEIMEAMGYAKDESYKEGLTNEMLVNQCPGNGDIIPGNH